MHPEGECLPLQTKEIAKLCRNPLILPKGTGIQVRLQLPLSSLMQKLLLDVKCGDAFKQGAALVRIQIIQARQLCVPLCQESKQTQEVTVVTLRGMSLR